MSLIYPAVDPTHRGGPTIAWTGPVLEALPPVPPIEPDPGDPDVPMPPPVPAAPFHLWAKRGGRLLVEFGSVDVEEYTIAELGPTATYRHRITVAGDDPSWAGLGATLDGDGFPCFADVLDTITWELWRDGVLVAEGRTEGEVVAGPRVDLAITGGGAIWRDRYLGDGGLLDLLGGAGSFPTASLGAWTITNLTHRWNTTDPYDGARCLEVQGGLGTVKGPWGATVAAKESTSVQVYSSVAVRLTGDTDPTQGVHVTTEIRNALTGAIVNPNWTREMGESSRPEVRGWQIVTAPGRLPQGTGLFQARTVITAADDTWVGLDRIRQTLRGMTGSTTPIRLGDLIRRVVARAQSEHCGGRLGVTVKVHSLSPTDAMTWDHTEDPSVEDALSSICDRSDGPDAWFTPDRVLHVASMAGRDRDDLVLNRDTVISARISSDPTLRFLEMRVQSGHGAGPGRQVLGWNRRANGVIARRAHRVAPPELTFRAAEQWGSGQARVEAYRHRAIEAVLPRVYGQRFGIGDRVAVSMAVDGLSVVGTQRVVRITEQPGDDTITVACTLPDEER